MKYLAEKAPAGRLSGSNCMIRYDFWSFLNDYIWFFKLFIWLYTIFEAPYVIIYDFWSFLYDYIRCLKFFIWLYMISEDVYMIICVFVEAFWRKIVITRRSKQLRSSYFACKGLWTCWIRFWYSQSLKLTKMICFWWFSFLTFCIFSFFHFLGRAIFGGWWQMGHGHLATSRLSCVSIETCADEVDFQVDLRLTWGRPEANVLNVLVNTTSWLEVDLRLTWGRPPGLHRRH